MSPYAHSSIQLEDPHVSAIQGFPGTYSVDFGDLHMHVTAAQWHAIDLAVRSGIYALEEAAS